MNAHLLGGAGLAVAVLLSGCQKAEQGEITFSDPYVKEPIASNNVTAGYITLVNGKASDLKLTGVSVSSDVAARAEVHGHKLDGDIMKMYQVPALDLPSGTPVKLEPGGYHVMLMGLKQPLTPASEVNVTFEFSDGENVNVAMPVRGIEKPEAAPAFVNADNTISIKNTSARATMPGMSTSAVYMTIENNSEKPLELVAVNSPLAKKTELHTTDMEEGVMKMRHVSTLAIDPGDDALLKPGSYHIMLMGLKKEIPAGMEVPVDLTFSDGTKASLNVLAMKKIPGQSKAH